MMADEHTSKLRTVVKWDRPDSSLNPPDEARLGLYKQLKTKYFLLVERFERRKRSPLQFRQAFSEFQRAITEAPQWVWPEVAEEVDYMRRFAATLQSHYRRCGPAAREQMERIRMAQIRRTWRPRVVPGGRADGNR